VEVVAFGEFVKASQIDESKITQGTLDEIVGLYLAADAEQLPFSTGDFLFDGLRMHFCEFLLIILFPL
jgi:hypothetical protein